MAAPVKTYRGFLLDADNTLFDYDGAEKESLTETLREAAPAIPLEQALSAYREINAAFWRRLEEGTVTLATLKVGRFVSLLESLGVPGDPHKFSEGYLARLSRKAYLLPHARETVGELSRRAALCLVTNGISVVQRGRLERAGIASLFKAVLISEELGMTKPDRRFFQAAVDALGLPPSELLCVGDNPSTDIAGAQEAGIDACWFAPDGRSWPGPGKAPVATIRDLREIEKFAPAVFQ